MFVLDSTIYIRALYIYGEAIYHNDQCSEELYKKSLYLVCVNHDSWRRNKSYSTTAATCFTTVTTHELFWSLAVEACLLSSLLLYFISSTFPQILLLPMTALKHLRACICLRTGANAARNTCDESRPINKASGRYYRAHWSYICIDFSQKTILDPRFLCIHIPHQVLQNCSPWT